MVRLTRRAFLAGLPAVPLVAGCRRRPARQESGALLIRGAPSVDATMAALVEAFRAVNQGIEVTSNCSCPPCVVFREGVDGGNFDVWAAWGEWEIERLTASGKMGFIETVTVGDSPLAIATSPEVREVVRGVGDLRDPAVRAIGVGEPEFVSSGHYARAALEPTGLWAEIEPKLKYSRSGCELLKWLGLERTVDAAIVFEACVDDDNVSVGPVVPIPEDVAPHVHFVLAISESATHVEAARSFLAFARGAEARGILAAGGIRPVGPT